jgi:hypothetical protein
LYYASFTSAQQPLLKLAAPCFDKLTKFDPVGASLDTIGADAIAGMPCASSNALAFWGCDGDAGHRAGAGFEVHVFLLLALVHQKRSHAKSFQSLLQIDPGPFQVF